MKRLRLRTIVGPGLLLAALALGMSVGSVRIPVPDILRILGGAGSDGPPSWTAILMQIRLPRVLAAAMVGGSLAVGGVACQGLFRNPLAEPYLLGISSGAALGAAVAVVAAPWAETAGLAGLGLIGTMAFLGALTVTGSVFLAAGRDAFRLPATLLLAGIAIGFLCQAVIWLLMTLHRDQVVRITFWTLGSLSSAGWTKVLWLSAVTLPAAFALSRLGRVMDVLSTGYAGAHGLGLNPRRASLAVLVLTSLGTAVSVAVAGSIGFVGLMIPHIMRLAGGPGHRGLVGRSWFGGAALLVLADVIARTVAAPGEIPVGIVTALLGAPFLMVLVRRSRAGGRLDG